MDCVIDDFNIIIKLFNNLKKSIIFYISEIKKLYSETVTGGNIESSINKFKNILSTFINSFIYFCKYKLSDNTNVIYFLLNMYVDTIRIKDIQYSKQGLICRYFIPSIILNSDNDTFYTNIKLNIYNEVTGGVDICSYDLIDPYDLKRSARIGIRLFMPMLGLIGYDIGYGFDSAGYGDGITPWGWDHHLIFGGTFN